MLLEYIQRRFAMQSMGSCRMMAAIMERFGECNGVYANSKTLEECREKLREVLEEWVLFRVHKNLRLPAIDGIELLIKEVA